MKPYAHATEVQTLLFDADLFTAKSAKAWARSHGFRYGKVDEGSPSAQYIRLRQHDPSEYRPGTLRTISLDHDETIKAVVGVPLRAVALYLLPAGGRRNGKVVSLAAAREKATRVDRPLPVGSRVLAHVTRGWHGATRYERAAWLPGTVIGDSGYGYNTVHLDTGNVLPTVYPRDIRHEFPVRRNPFGKYRGVSYYHTAGVYRAHLPDGTTQVFGAKDGGKRGMQEFIDEYLWAPGETRAAKNPYSSWGQYAPSTKCPYSAMDRVYLRGSPEREGIVVDTSRYARRQEVLVRFADGTEWWTRTSLLERASPRHNPERVVVPGLGTGAVVARRPGGMVDIRLSLGTVVRKPLSSLRPV